MRIRWKHLAVAAVAALWAAPSMPSVAGSRIEKTLDLDPGGKLVLRAKSGSIEILGGAREKAFLTVTAEDDDLEQKLDLSVETSPGLLLITARSKGSQEGLSSWLSGWFTGDSPGRTIRKLRFRVEVPSRTRIEVESGGGHIEVSSIEGQAKITTAGGHIKADNVEGGLSAATSGGHIEVANARGDASLESAGGHIEVRSLDGAADVRTSGGHLRLESVTGDVRAETSGGHIKINGAGGRVVAETSGGAVEVSFAPGNDRGGELVSAGGGIRVRLDATVDLTIDASTAAGKVSCGFALSQEAERSRSRLRGSLGRGGERLRVRTQGGPVTFEPL